MVQFEYSPVSYVNSKTKAREQQRYLISKLLFPSPPFELEIHGVFCTCSIILEYLSSTVRSFLLTCSLLLNVVTDPLEVCKTSTHNNIYIS